MDACAHTWDEAACLRPRETRGLPQLSAAAPAAARVTSATGRSCCPRRELLDWEARVEESVRNLQQMVLEASLVDDGGDGSRS